MHGCRFCMSAAASTLAAAVLPPAPCRQRTSGKRSSLRSVGTNRLYRSVCPLLARNSLTENAAFAPPGRACSFTPRRPFASSAASSCSPSVSSMSKPAARFQNCSPSSARESLPSVFVSLTASRSRLPASSAARDGVRTKVTKYSSAGMNFNMNCGMAGLMARSPNHSQGSRRVRSRYGFCGCSRCRAGLRARRRRGS